MSRQESPRSPAGLECRLIVPRGRRAVVNNTVSDNIGSVGPPPRSYEESRLLSDAKCSIGVVPVSQNYFSTWVWGGKIRVEICE